MRHCPICNGAPINDRPDLPAMQHTCSLCGWHYSARSTLELGPSIVNPPPDVGCPGTDDESPAAMAKELRLAALHRARRTIVLEIDCLHADQENDRAQALQAALDAIDGFMHSAYEHGRSWL